MHNQTLQTLEVDDKLTFIYQLIDSAEYDVAVKESCTVFEVVFRKIVQQAMVSLPFNERTEISNTENKIGKGVKGVEDFGFGELVGLFREADVLEKWSKHNARDMGLLKTLNFSAIVNLRNKITHHGVSCSRAEANIVYEYLKNLLAVLGFADLDHSINQSFNKNTSTHAVVTQEAEQKTLHEKLPKIKKTTKTKSIYSSSKNNEHHRLKTQSENNRSFDLKLFDKAIDLLENKQELVGIDIGCAGGFLTFDRFNEYDSHFSNVVGIDINADKIAEANDSNYGNKYSFHCLDIETDSFDQEIKDRLQQETNTDKADVIFSALTLHHLGNPIKALLRLRKLLKKDGVLIIRGSDDGTKIGYPDDQWLIESVMKLTSEANGVSDRDNGRKIYSQLKRAGFQDIHKFHNIKDTANKNSDERYNLFEESFSYRINYFRNQLESDPSNVHYQEEYEWMKDALEELEIMFLDNSFYYMEMSIAAIAKR